MGLSLLVGCKPAHEEPAVVAEPAPAALCGESGALRATIYGAIEMRLDWDKHELECSGMPRPEGQGARLRLAGGTEDGHAIAFIVAIPELDRDVATAEFSANVTLIEEGNGRFFSTPDLDNCLADIAAVESLDDSGNRYSISGALYCVVPLPEINGTSSVSIPEMHFTGLLDWSAS